MVGFELGADDFVGKAGLSLRELPLRLRAVLRRAARSSAPTIDLQPPRGRVRLDRGARRVWRDAEELLLTDIEYRLLIALMEQAGRVVTRAALLEAVWHAPADLPTRTIDTHLKRLREKLGDARDEIVTVRGVGYRYDPLSPRPRPRRG